MLEQKAKNNGQDKKAIYAGGIITDINDGGLSKEFITAGKTIDESVGRTVFQTLAQLNACIRLYRKAKKFRNYGALMDIKMRLDGLPAVGGYNRAQALMSGAGIVVGEAMGVRLGKDSMKFIEKQVEAKARVDKDARQNEE